MKIIMLFLISPKNFSRSSIFGTSERRIESGENKKLQHREVVQASTLESLQYLKYHSMLTLQITSVFTYYSVFTIPTPPIW